MTKSAARDHETARLGSDVSLLAYHQYLRGVRHCMRVTREEEKRLLQCVLRGRQERMKDQPDQEVLRQAREARDCLVECYQPVIIRLASRFARRARGSVEFLDLVQEGNMALLGLLEKVKEASRAFPGLVVCCVRSALFDALYECDATVRVSDCMRDRLAKLRKARTELVERFDREPSLAELAAEMGLSRREMLELHEAEGRLYAESVQGLLWEDEDEDRREYVALYQEAGRGEKRSLSLHEQVRAVVERLPERQRRIVRLRYGFDGGLEARTTRGETSELRGFLGSVKSIAEFLELSNSTASTELCRANRRLREELASLVEYQAVNA
jgi:RNA polymerase primary sigma factor